MILKSKWLSLLNKSGELEIRQL